MSSIFSDFEYDIFISYRHNDNRSGWVTEFVNALQEELAATIKEPLSLYFDKNPHDGLLETHSVDKTVEGKLKCLIFIPIISQTYCDPKSFAWRNEFCVFNKSAKEDPFGRDVKLGNGNIASRILPVKIHDLDIADNATIEKEIGCALRAIEFIYREAGVNRPLKLEDKKEDNLNKTVYRNQVNKVANGIKEIIFSLKNSGSNVSQTTLKNPFSVAEFEPSGSRTKAKRKILIPAVFFVALLGLCIYAYDQTHASKEISTIPINKSIAVLPFENLNKDADQDYFSDGITLDIIAQLSKINDLRVISRASVIRYKNSPKDFKEIAKELNVTTLLQGVVRQSGNKVRISASLINASTGEQLWSEMYDRELKDIFEIQSNVSKEIASALKAELTPFQQARLEKKPTVNIEAYKLYLQGKFHWGKLSNSELAKALELFKQAIEMDPNFALAYVGLADTYSLIAFFHITSILPAREAMLNAKEAALKAIALDNALAEAYVSMGYILRTYDWNWSAAEESYKKAIALNSNYATGHDYYALLLTCLGRFEEAKLESQSAMNLDPLSTLTNLDGSRILRYYGKLKESMEIAQKTLELNPNAKFIHRHIGLLMELRGAKDSAVLEFLKEQGDIAPNETNGVKEYNQFCQTDLNRLLMDSLNSSAENIAQSYMRIGNHEKAIQYLQKSYKNREGTLVYLNVEPLYRPLHRDKRFKNIVLAMGLRPKVN